ncbi:MAG TPA: Rrf2 family transcriptional regulator [Candidatus Saccharimonadales bacterium]|nr:Rrf2 family transcriptional regulator [Candidatus Saccharimonadales bacterium]
MQLTRAADYAVRVMIHLASQPEGAIVPKKLLATAAEAPESFLSKILQSLSRAGLIQTRRGVVGGFSLLPRGAKASMLEVVECIDGPIALNVCVTSGISCNRQGECAAHRVWVRAQAAMLSVLNDAKIAEMIPVRSLCDTRINLTQVSGSLEPESMLPIDLPHESRNRARTEFVSTGVPHAGPGKKNTKN